MSEDHIISETERVREDWTRRGKHWDSRADEVAEMADRFNQPLIEAVGIAPGHKVLDLASGAGEPALTVAGMVAPEGSVHCTDLVPEMMEGREAARRRRRLCRTSPSAPPTCARCRTRTRASTGRSAGSA